MSLQEIGEGGYSNYNTVHNDGDMEEEEEEEEDEIERWRAMEWN